MCKLNFNKLDFLKNHIAGRHPRDSLWVRKNDLPALSPESPAPRARAAVLSPYPPNCNSQPLQCLGLRILWLQEVNTCTGFPTPRNQKQQSGVGKDPNALESEKLEENLHVCHFPAVCLGKPAPCEVG